MVIIDDQGALPGVAPRCHLQVTASMRQLRRAFGEPDMRTAAAWIVRVTPPGRRCPKEAILRPVADLNTFDPRAQQSRSAWWELVSAADQPGSVGDQAFAPVLAAILGTGSAGPKAARPGTVTAGDVLELNHGQRPFVHDPDDPLTIRLSAALSNLEPQTNDQPKGAK